MNLEGALFSLEEVDEFRVASHQGEGVGCFGQRQTVS